MPNGIQYIQKWLFHEKRSNRPLATVSIAQAAIKIIVKNEEDSRVAGWRRRYKTTRPAASAAILSCKSCVAIGSPWRMASSR
jgi:hypothetical protein